MKRFVLYGWFLGGILFLIINFVVLFSVTPEPQTTNTMRVSNEIYHFGDSLFHPVKTGSTPPKQQSHESCPVFLASGNLPLSINDFTAIRQKPVVRENVPVTRQPVVISDFIKPFRLILLFLIFYQRSRTSSGDDPGSNSFSKIANKLIRCDSSSRTRSNLSI